MKVYGYIRVSTEKQGDNGHSLDAQEGAIKVYCTGKGFALDHVYVDPGVSAGKPLAKRPQGEVLVASLKSGDHVIAVKLDRLFRNVLDCMTNVELWQRQGVTMHLLDLNVDTSTLSGKLVLQVLAAVAEMERGLTKERNRAVSQHLKASGRVYGSIPYGYDREGDKLKPNPVEQHVLKRMRAMKRAGVNANRIAERLNSEGIPSKTGVKWGRMAVGKVLKGV